MLQQLRNPDTVLHVRLAPGDLLDMCGVHEETGEVVFQRVEHPLPIDARAVLPRAHTPPHHSTPVPPTPGASARGGGSQSCSTSRSPTVVPNVCTCCSA